MAASLFLPDIAGTFLSGWNCRASFMYLLLICLSETISFSGNPKMPSASLRFTPNPSGSYPLFFYGGGEGGKFVLVTFLLALTSSGWWWTRWWTILGSGGVRRR